MDPASSDAEIPAALYAGSIDRVAGLGVLGSIFRRNQFPREHPASLQDSLRLESLSHLLVVQTSPDRLMSYK